METIEYKGYIIHIDRDNSPQSPREWDNLGTIAIQHNRDFEGDVEVTPEELTALTKDKSLIWLPIRAYIHSGIFLRAIMPGTDLPYPFDDQWDSAWAGIIYMPKDKLAKEKINDDQTREILRQEVETYSQYLEGDVWYYSIALPSQELTLNKQTTTIPGEVLDTLGDIYGYDEALSQAKAFINSNIEAEIKRLQTLLEED